MWSQPDAAITNQTVLIQAETSRSLSLSSLHKLSPGISRSLRILSVITIAVLSPNTLGVVPLNYGCFHAGCILVALNLMLDSDTLAYQLGHSGADVLMVHVSAVKLAEAVVEKLEPGDRGKAYGVYYFGERKPDVGYIPIRVSCFTSRARIGSGCRRRPRSGWTIQR